MPIDSLGIKLAKRIGMRRQKASWHETPRWLVHCIRIEHVLNRIRRRKPDPGCQLPIRAAGLAMSAGMRCDDLIHGGSSSALRCRA